MPAHFTVRTIRPNNGIRQVHLSLDQGQPNEVLYNVTADVLRLLFNADVHEGDVRAASNACQPRRNEWKEARSMTLDHAITIRDVLMISGLSIGTIVLVFGIYVLVVWIKMRREYRDALRPESD